LVALSAPTSTSAENAGVHEAARRARRRLTGSGVERAPRGRIEIKTDRPNRAILMVSQPIRMG
jgi:hypothetical protein